MRPWAGARSRVEARVLVRVQGQSEGEGQGKVVRARGTEDDIPLVVLRMHDWENPFDIAPNGFDDTYDDAGFVAAGGDG